MISKGYLLDLRHAKIKNCLVKVIFLLKQNVGNIKDIRAVVIKTMRTTKKIIYQTFGDIYKLTIELR